MPNEAYQSPGIQEIHEGLAQTQVRMEAALDRLSSVMGYGNPPPSVSPTGEAAGHEVGSVDKLKEEFLTKKTATAANKLVAQVNRVLGATSRNAAARHEAAANQAKAGLEAMREIKDVIQPQLTNATVGLARLVKEHMKGQSRAATLSIVKKLAARRQYELDIAAAVDYYKEIEASQTELKTLQDRIRSLRSAADSSVSETGSGLSEMQRSQQLIEFTRKEASRRLAEHFGVEEQGSGYKGREPDLIMPADIEKGDKHALIDDSITLYLKSRPIATSAILMSVFKRMFADRDQKRGTFWSLATEDMPKILRDPWNRQNALFYKTLLKKLPVRVRARLHQTFTYGTPAVAVSEGVEEENGAQLMHAVLCVYNTPLEVKVAAIRDKIIASPATFRRGNPAEASSRLRKLIRLGLECELMLPWSMCAERIVTIVSARDNSLATTLIPFQLEGTEYTNMPSPDDSLVTMDTMLESIERACERINRASDNMTTYHADSIRINDEKLADKWNSQARGGMGTKGGRNAGGTPWVPKAELKPWYLSATRTSTENMRCEFPKCRNSVSNNRFPWCQTCHFKIVDKQYPVGTVLHLIPSKVTGKDRCVEITMGDPKCSNFDIRPSGSRRRYDWHPPTAPWRSSSRGARQERGDRRSTGGKGKGDRGRGTGKGGKGGWGSRGPSRTPRDEAPPPPPPRNHDAHDVMITPKVAQYIANTIHSRMKRDSDHDVFEANTVEVGGNVSLFSNSLVSVGRQLSAYTHNPTPPVTTLAPQSISRSASRSPSLEGTRSCARSPSYTPSSPSIVPDQVSESIERSVEEEMMQERQPAAEAQEHVRIFRSPVPSAATVQMPINNCTPVRRNIWTPREGEVKSPTGSADVKEVTEAEAASVSPPVADTLKSALQPDTGTTRKGIRVTFSPTEPMKVERVVEETGEDTVFAGNAEAEEAFDESLLTAEEISDAEFIDLYGDNEPKVDISEAAEALVQLGVDGGISPQLTDLMDVHGERPPTPLSRLSHHAMLSQVYCAGLHLKCPELVMDTEEVGLLMDRGEHSGGHVDAQGADSESERIEIVWDQPTYEQLTKTSLTELHAEDDEEDPAQPEVGMDEPLSKRLRRSSQ